MNSLGWLATGPGWPLALALALLAAPSFSSAQTSRASSEPVLRLSADPASASELCIRIDGDQHTRTIELRLVPPPALLSVKSGTALHPASPPPAHDSHWAARISNATYALSAAALSTLALGIGLGVRGRVELARYDERCSGQPCSESAGTHGKRLYIATDVSLALSASFTVAALWSYLARDMRAERAPSRLRRSLPEVSLGAKRGLLVWGSRF